VPPGEEPAPPQPAHDATVRLLIFALAAKRFVELAVVEKIFVVVPFVNEKLGAVSTPVDGLKVSLVEETF
jgi:hypothetical protein